MIRTHLVETCNPAAPLGWASLLHLPVLPPTPRQALWVLLPTWPHWPQAPQGWAAACSPPSSPLEPWRGGCLFKRFTLGCWACEGMKICFGNLSPTIKSHKEFRVGGGESCLLLLLLVIWLVVYLIGCLLA